MTSVLEFLRNKIMGTWPLIDTAKTLKRKKKY